MECLNFSLARIQSPLFWIQPPIHKVSPITTLAAPMVPGRGGLFAENVIPQISSAKRRHTTLSLYSSAEVMLWQTFLETIHKICTK
jgi:hypothetical protein